MSYYFRVDSNENIGIGHMMRCLAIARAMRQMGQEATFFVADKKSAAIAAQNGFGYYCLNTDYDHPDVEADKFIQIIRDRGAENLLVDSYYVTENYLKKIREVTNLTYIDDINRFIYPCDLLINYNIYASGLRYEERYREAGFPDTAFALGPSYMPLREEYADLFGRRKACAERRNNSGDMEPSGIRVMITTGSTDKYNVTGKILEKAAEHGLIGKAASSCKGGANTCSTYGLNMRSVNAYSMNMGSTPEDAGSDHNSRNSDDGRCPAQVVPVTFSVLVGQYNNHKTELEEQFGSGRCPGVQLLEPQPTLADLIASCDIAVTAGGTTVYELCAGGIASVMLTIADNQMRAAREFSAKGLIPYAGDVREDTDAVAENVVRQIEAYIADPAGREAAGEKMCSVVDGRGAERLAELLIRRMR